MDANPILNGPWDEPSRHWKLDEYFKQTAEIAGGRRASGAYLSVPAPRRGPRPKGDCALMAPHPGINAIRGHVGAWRRAGYSGARERTRRLLEWWAGDGPRERPFFAQREAVETVIWLKESRTPESLAAAQTLAGTNARWNDAIERIAVKMATGTGKTRVMAMILLWLALVRPEGVRAAVIAPNRTVKARLDELDPGGRNGAAIYEGLMPRGEPAPVGKLDIRILNYQQFRRRSKLGIAGEDDKPGGVAKKLIWGAQGPAEEQEFESGEKMLERLLGPRKGEVVVFNDEAHHCYAPFGAGRGAADREIRRDEDEAGMWFGALRLMRAHGRLGTVFDLTATPMWLRQPEGVEHPEAMFPWTVSDYPLVEAVEAGLTKIPRVPIDDDAGGEKIVAYRNIWRALSVRTRAKKHRLNSASLPAEVEETLETMARDYGAGAPDGAAAPPVMIIVANDTANANELYRYIAGGQGGDGAWRPGRFDIFSNVARDGKIKDSPPTLLKHSRVDEEENAEVGEMQKAFFSPPGDEPTKKERNAWIDEVFATVGRRGKPGERIRCIVSVQMLSEGWDVRTVTHVYGFRAFGSQLLCEQVAGRALRRTGFPVLGPGDRFGPQYARICGVPFDWMVNKAGPGAPAPPTFRVESLPGRESLRIAFPNIAAYAVEPPAPAIRLRPERVRPFDAGDPQHPNRVTWAGPIGARDVSEAPGRRPNRVLYAIAARAAQHFREAGKIDPARHRRQVFAAMVLAAREWARHPKVNLGPEDLRLLHASSAGEQAAIDIAHACAVVENGRTKILPVFADERDPRQPRSLDTSGVAFETALRNRYPAAAADGPAERSELGIAACHAAPEARIAALLDSHGDIEAWARNYRLGWYIPWLDRRTGLWRYYEPDFVARAKCAARAHLVIEYKDEAGTAAGGAAARKQDAAERWWLPAVNGAADPACEGRWAYLYLTAENDWNFEIARAARALCAQAKERE